MSGFKDLASALTGGLEPMKQDAFLKGQLQSANVQHLSAETQDALANATLHQMQGRIAQQKADARNTLADRLLASGVAKSPEEAQLGAAVMTGETGNFEQFEQGMGHAQQRDFRTTLADPNASEDQRLRASSGVTGKVQSSVDDATPAAKNFKFEQGLPADQRAGFRDYALPPKYITAGGVPVEVGPGRAPKQVLPTDVVANNTRATSGAKAEGQAVAKLKIDQPQAKARLDASDQKVDSISQYANEIANDPALTSAVGLGKPLASIWGTNPLKVRAKINTLKSKIALAVITDLRQSSKTGGALGNVSDKDIELVKNGIAALDERMSAEDFIDQLKVVDGYVKDIKDRMHEAYDANYGAHGIANGGGSSPAPAANPRNMTSAERAKAMGL